MAMTDSCWCGLPTILINPSPRTSFNYWSAMFVNYQLQFHIFTISVFVFYSVAALPTLMLQSFCTDPLWCSDRFLLLFRVLLACICPFLSPLHILSSPRFLLSLISRLPFTWISGTLAQISPFSFPQRYQLSPQVKPMLWAVLSSVSSFHRMNILASSFTYFNCHYFVLFFVVFPLGDRTKPTEGYRKCSLIWQMSPLCI